MRPIRVITSFIAVFMAVSTVCSAKIITPAILGDNMVVKRNSTAKIWGWSSAGEQVSIIADWNTADTVRVISDAGSRFEAEIKTPEAGGPYTITVKGSTDEKVFKNVLVGEVWLCSGQSNMQMSIGTTYGTKVDYHDKFAKLDNPQIRTFVTPRLASSTPQDDCKGNWDECNSETISDVSLTAYFFAEKLQKELNVPVGVVVSAWGGTFAEVWVPDEARTVNYDIDKSAKSIVPTNWMPTETSSLYNSMISPLVPYNFSGAIWYQGESNIINYRYYDSVMKTLISEWRAKFNAELPFYFVQIAPFSYNDNYTGYAAYLREQQNITAKYKNTGMAVINDLIDDVYNIHPKNKHDVGARLANLALNRDYERKDVDCNYPEVESVTAEGNKLVLKLKNCDKGVYVVDSKNTGFKIADELGNFVEASAKAEGNTITLSAKGVKNPCYVRYLFDDTSICGIKGNNGLPLIPYRNDKF